MVAVVGAFGTLGDGKVGLLASNAIGQSNQFVLESIGYKIYYSLFGEIFQTYIYKCIYKLILMKLILMKLILMKLIFDEICLDEINLIFKSILMKLMLIKQNRDNALQTPIFNNQ